MRHSSSHSPAILVVRFTRYEQQNIQVNYLEGARQMLSLRSVNQFYGKNHILWNVDLDLPPAPVPAYWDVPAWEKPRW